METKDNFDYLLYNHNVHTWHLHCLIISADYILSQQHILNKTFIKIDGNKRKKGERMEKEVLVSRGRLELK